MLIKPTRPKLTLKNLGNKELTLNFVTIADENWIQERYPDKTWEESFVRNEVDPTLDIFWRLLSDESKRLVASVRFTEWKGSKETPLDIDEPIERLKRIISGADEVMAMVSAILQSKTQSLPPQVEKKKQ